MSDKLILKNRFNKILIQARVWISILGFLIMSVEVANAQCTMVCKGDLNISLNSQGLALITPTLILSSAPDCLGPFDVSLSDTDGNNYGNTVNCQQVGLTLSAKVTDTNSGNFCKTNITINDYLNPVLICKDTLIYCYESIDPLNIGFPIAYDNCTTFSHADLNFTDHIIDLPCLTIEGHDTIVARIERTWTVADASGNQVSCIQNIYLERTTISQVQFPEDKSNSLGTALSCSLDDPTDLSLTGVPTANNIPISNSGLCDLYRFYSDNSFPTCGGASRIFRHWQVVDECTNETINHVQVIELVDNQAPTLECPDSLSIEADIDFCGATVTLPLASATDYCSEVSITPQWAFGTGYGPYVDVPAGRHEVLYIAMDACGNKDSCTMEVHIFDKDEPTIICKENIAISLLANGTVTVPAEVFDSGSSDNCGIDRFEVGRNGIDFMDYILFDCGDLDTIPQVYLRVYDVNGFYNTCQVEVALMDNISPTITCPIDLTIACTDDPFDLDLTGLATAADNCSIDTIYFEDQLLPIGQTGSLNDCNSGTITRIWFAKDMAGKTTTCQQYISIEDQTPIQVQYPDHFMTYECGADLSPERLGFPLVTGDDCEDIDLNYEDQVYEFNSSSCYNILREWTLVDWCVYDPNDPDTEGIWTANQLIEVKDSIAPILTSLKDTMVYHSSADCSGVFVTLPTAIAIDCNTNILISNDSPYADSSGANASGFYPPGIHDITFTSNDDCGNSSTSSFTLTILDGLSPNAVCLSIVSVNIESNGLATISAEDINASSFDNCSTLDSLVFEISNLPTGQPGHVFTCDELGVHEVQLTVTDEAGNSSTCTSLVEVQNHMGFCPEHKISGRVTTEDGRPFESAVLQLEGEELLHQISDVNGHFSFDHLPQYTDYRITGIGEGSPLNGVSTLDIVQISQYILGLKDFNSPYQFLAADANASGNITVSDLVYIRQLILGRLDSFPNQETWKFVDAQYQFQNPNNPFSESYDQALNFNNLQSDILDANFIAVKVGDVSGNATPSGLQNSSSQVETRIARSNINFTTTDVWLEKGESHIVSFKAEELLSILGFQFTLALEHSTFVKPTNQTDLFFESDLPEFDKSHLNIEQVGEGLLTASWVNPYEEEISQEALIFEIEIKAEKAGYLSDFLTFNSRITQTEAYDLHAQTLDLHLKFTSPQTASSSEQETIETSKGQETSVGPAPLEEQETSAGHETSKGPETATQPESILHQNFPNPFTHSTTIPFHLANRSGKMTEAEAVQLSIFNQQGQLVKSMASEFSSGEQQFQLNANDLPKTPGIFYYQIKTSSGLSKTKKMMRIGR